MVNQFLSGLYLVFISITSMLFFVVALLIRLLTFPFDKRRIVQSLFSSFWASFYLWCMPAWKVRKTGTGKLDLSKNYVIVSNHQSQLDILLAFNLFYPFRWVSKKEVFHIPVIGWNMMLNGYVKLKRGDRESVKQMMSRCERLLAGGCSIFLFPEGTRSATGELKRFKPGAFILAQRVKANILPLVIEGTSRALPKHALHLTGKKEMHIKVLDEIPYNDIARKSPEEAAEYVRGIIRENMAGVA